MYNSHETIKSLKEAGFSESQAEAILGALHRNWDARIGELATKNDLRDLRDALKEDIRTVRSDMKDQELRITMRIGAMITAAVAILGAMIKFF